MCFNLEEQNIPLSVPWIKGVILFFSFYLFIFLLGDYRGRYSCMDNMCFMESFLGVNVNAIYIKRISYQSHIISFDLMIVCLFPSAWIGIMPDEEYAQSKWFEKEHSAGKWCIIHLQKITLISSYGFTKGKKNKKWKIKLISISLLTNIFKN